MKRIEAIALAASAAEKKNALLICNLGFPSRELYATKDRPLNFYMLGSMGLASSIGLGLAIARKDQHVIVLDGDGSVLMNLGTLVTIGHHAPSNYAQVILDNGCYGSTGMQPTFTGKGSNLGLIARAAGINSVAEAFNAEELNDALFSGAMVIIAKVEPGNADVPAIDLSGREIIDRFVRSFRKP